MFNWLRRKARPPRVEVAEPAAQPAGRPARRPVVLSVASPLDRANLEVDEFPPPRLSRGTSISGSPTRDLQHQQWHIRLDLAPQVMSLEIPDETTLEDGEERLYPTCPITDFVSASMLALKAKVFDDGLYAAVELAEQPAKARLLLALANVAPPVAAAARLAGLTVPLSPDAQQLLNTFLADELASKPLGFYTWRDSLRCIFRQDRMLQRELSPDDARSLAAALHADTALLNAYANCLELVSKLTNPFVAAMPDLRQPGGKWFFPASRAHETEPVKRLYGDTPIPEGFSLADEMVMRLRDGALCLAPTDSSGWYDLQAWALEALVLLDKMPEGARLRINDRYRAQIEDLFKAVLSLTCETHVKQLEIAVVGAMLRRAKPSLARVRPDLTVEPVRTYYERRAHGYTFVRQVLEALPLDEMHRVTPNGKAARPLGEELAEMIAIFRGAAAVVGDELGMAPASDDEARRFRESAAGPDVTEDVRMMVPVFYDRERSQTKVWAVLGWAYRTLAVSFATPPAVEVLAGEVEIRFEKALRGIAYPVFAEAYVSRLLDRDEFRAHCDRHETRSRILQNLPK